MKNIIFYISNNISIIYFDMYKKYGKEKYYVIYIIFYYISLYIKYELL